MVTIIADATVQAALGLLSEPAEIRSPNGKLLGYFTPANRERLYAEARTQFDPEEMKRRKHANVPGHSLHEILERLNSAAPS